MLGKNGYVSEFTQFIEAYLKAHPEEAAAQVKGRELLWDRLPEDVEIERQLQQTFSASETALRNRL